MRLFYATQAVSEYSPQISLLQLCMCVIEMIKFQGRDTPCAPLPLKKPCPCANMRKYLYMNKSEHGYLCLLFGAQLNYAQFTLEVINIDTCVQCNC